MERKQYIAWQRTSLKYDTTDTCIWNLFATKNIVEWNWIAEIDLELKEKQAHLQFKMVDCKNGAAYKTGATRCTPGLEETLLYVYLKSKKSKTPEQASRNNLQMQTRKYLNTICGTLAKQEIMISIYILVPGYNMKDNWSG